MIRSPEAIVPEVVSEDSILTEMGTRVVYLTLGSKRLTLEIHLAAGIAATYAETINKPRIPGETTKLYQAVKDKLEEVAAEHPRGEIVFSFETGFPNMVRWAKGPGNDIFGWRTIYHTIDDPQKISATAVIRAKPDKT
jgi:hypothetical protein